MRAYARFANLRAYAHIDDGSIMSLDVAAGLDLLRQRLAEDRHLVVLVTTRQGRDDPQVSIVNAAVIEHPLTAAPVLALVSRRGPKLSNLRKQRHATAVARAGWEWVAVSGPVELSGPDDAHPGIDTEAQRQLLRTIFTAAGGSHPDLVVYDQVMLAERRCAVLLNPERIWTNPPSSEHVEPGSR